MIVRSVGQQPIGGVRVRCEASRLGLKIALTDVTQWAGLTYPVPPRGQAWSVVG